MRSLEALGLDVGLLGIQLRLPPPALLPLPVLRRLLSPALVVVPGTWVEWRRTELGGELVVARRAPQVAGLEARIEAAGTVGRTLIGMRLRIGDAVVPCRPHTEPGLTTSEALEVLCAPLLAIFEANLDQGEDRHQDREESDQPEGEEGDDLVVGAAVGADAISGHGGRREHQQRDQGEERRQQTRELAESHPGQSNAPPGRLGLSGF